MKMDFPDISKEPPHRVADKVLDSLIDIPKNVGESINSALDKGPLGDSGPHRIVDSIVKGLIQGLETSGEGVAKGLDKPLEAIKK